MMYADIITSTAIIRIVCLVGTYFQVGVGQWQSRCVTQLRETTENTGSLTLRNFTLR